MCNVIVITKFDLVRSFYVIHILYCSWLDTSIDDVRKAHNWLFVDFSLKCHLRSSATNSCKKRLLLTQSTHRGYSTMAKRGNLSLAHREHLGYIPALEDFPPFFGWFRLFSVIFENGSKATWQPRQKVRNLSFFVSFILGFFCCMCSATCHCRQVNGVLEWRTKCLCYPEVF